MKSAAMAVLALGVCWLTLNACGGATAAGVHGTAPAPSTRVIRLTASRWRFEPETITLARGEPVVIELRSSDVQHGFNVPALGVRADVVPEQVTRVSLTPQQIGTFPFHSD
jgi:cytochrome c oxidase subunit 2